MPNKKKQMIEEVFVNEKSNIGFIVFVRGIERIYGRSVCGFGCGGDRGNRRRKKRNHRQLYMVTRRLGQPHHQR